MLIQRHIVRILVRVGEGCETLLGVQDFLDIRSEGSEIVVSLRFDPCNVGVIHQFLVSHVLFHGDLIQFSVVFPKKFRPAVILFACLFLIVVEGLNRLLQFGGGLEFEFFACENTDGDSAACVTLRRRDGGRVVHDDGKRVTVCVLIALDGIQSLFGCGDIHALASFLFFYC